MRHRVLGLAALAALAGAATAADGLRIAAWNITTYSGGHQPEIATVAYGVFDGRSMDPDVILLNEMTSLSAVNSVVQALNNGLGSNDWVAAPFFTGSSGGLNNALVYRESQLDLLAATLLWPGTSTEQPRNIVRYDLRLDGYASEEATISFYPTHMKAGSGSGDIARRLIESQRIRDDAETLPAGRNFVIGGDTNTQSSAQSCYQELVGSQANNAGRFFDPIAAPGTWNNSSTFRYLHTQDPSGAGGMDDRHDQLLASASFGDQVGLDYVGLFDTPWNLSTWNDPNHSYRCWGNDGTSFNLSLTTTGNVNVGATIAQAIITMAGSGGHCPVFFDTVVPARAGATASIDFGTVNVGDTAQATLEVYNAGDTARWGAAGIEDLSYTLIAPVGFTVPGGPFTDAAGGGVNTHTVTMLTSTPGIYSGTLYVFSNDPESPPLAVALTGEVADSSCPADIAPPFGVLDLQDINAFIAGFLGNDPIADIAEPFGILDLQDVNLFISSFVAGCP
ncbi:MAG: choice-of-anchor D domain-containing protein [Phycisphaeraceae bacterium]|nr:MAG: choice-of-anchor D domain-containing protein [Phycisphaeraceae bacterium]